MKLSKIGIILVVIHLAFFGLMMGLAEFGIGCQEWGCIGYAILGAFPWSILGVVMGLERYMNEFSVIILNVATFYFIGQVITNLRNKSSNQNINLPRA